MGLASELTSVRRDKDLRLWELAIELSRDESCKPLEEVAELLDDLGATPQELERRVARVREGRRDWRRRNSKRDNGVEVEELQRRLVDAKAALRRAERRYREALSALRAARVYSLTAKEVSRKGRVAFSFLPDDLRAKLEAEEEGGADDE